MDPRRPKNHNPFSRPWMYNQSVAASGGPGGVKGLIVGGITGGIEICFSYPMEFIKTKLQLDAKSGKERKYTGFNDVIRKTIKENGFFGLYRGLPALLIFSVPKVGIRFGTFEMLKSMIVNEKGNIGPLASLLCGLGAGVAEAVFVVTPMETIKIKFIHDQAKPKPLYKGFIHGISTIIKHEGFSGVYQGMVPTVIRQGSNQAMRFFVMETCKNKYRGGDPSVVIPTPIIGLMGIASGVASVTSNNPIDVVKTRMQGLEAKLYKNSLDCLIQIWKKEGIRGYYKGAQTRLLRVCFDASFSFMFYEKIMAIFG